MDGWSSERTSEQPPPGSTGSLPDLRAFFRSLPGGASGSRPGGANVRREVLELRFLLLEVGGEEVAHREAADDAPLVEHRQVAAVSLAQLLLAVVHGVVELGGDHVARHDLV